MEQRPVPAFASRRKDAASKYWRRMNSAVKEIAAMLAGYATRRKFAAVKYTDADTSFCTGFPWFALRERIKENFDEAGIEFEHASESGGVRYNAIARKRVITWKR